MTLTRSALVAGLCLTLLLGAGGAAGTAGQLRPLFPLFDRRGCQLETHPLAFGNYDPLSGRGVDALGSVRYVCGRVEAPERVLRDVRIEISRGLLNSYDRAMTAGTNDHLRYNLFLDAAHTTVWGDGSSNTDYYLDRRPPNDSSVSVPIYGQIFALQDVPAGNYLDVVQVTIFF
jgi:spore coat protein U-like protein